MSKEDGKGEVDNSVFTKRLSIPQRAKARVRPRRKEINH